MKRKVLFVCIHNSARSQMAEAFLNSICPEQFEAHSAGLEPGTLNANVVETMREIGIDISHKRTRAVSEFLKAGEMFSYVITVCDGASAERCPLFPGLTTRLHWGFQDPSRFSGTREHVLSRTREVRDTIRRKVEAWCAEVCQCARND